MIKVILFIVLAIYGVPAQSTFTDSSHIEELIQKWDNRDGEQFIEIGSELSKCFVENDSVFLERMSRHDKSFESWVDHLQASSFTAYEAGDDSVEQVLYSAFYNKLKELMLDKAKKWINDSKYKLMAAALIRKLNTIEIRSIE